MLEEKFYRHIRITMKVLAQTNHEYFETHLYNVKRLAFHRSQFHLIHLSNYINYVITFQVIHWLAFQEEFSVILSKYYTIKPI